MKKNEQKADFIELDKTQFKKKSQNIIFILIFLVLVFLTSTIYLIKEKLEIKTIKQTQQEKKIKDKDKERMDFIEEPIEENVIRNKINTLSLTKQKENFNEQNLNVQLSDIIKKQEDNQFNIKVNQETINQLSSIIEEKVIESNINEYNRINEKIKLKNLQLYNFLLFKKKFFNGESFKDQIEKIESFFSQNESIYEYINFFYKIREKKVVTLKNLHSDLDKMINRNKTLNFDYSGSDRKLMSDSSEYSALRKFMNQYVYTFIDSNLKIKKADDLKNLDSYKDLNNDGIQDFKNVLISVKESLLLGDLRLVIEKIEKINSPISKDLESWIYDVKSLHKIREKFFAFEDVFFKKFYTEND